MKLLHLDEIFGLFDDTPARVIDLCAAPGSWSQVLSDRLKRQGTQIVAVDLQAMAPLEGVTQIVGDITASQTVNAVTHALVGAEASEAKAQLVVCDGAPDVTGLHTLDEFLQSQLLMSALTITGHLLGKGGTFAAKIFCRHDVQHDTSTALFCQLRTLFEHVDIVKPKSSRESSMEHFVVCLSFKGGATLGDLTNYAAFGTLETLN